MNRRAFLAGCVAAGASFHGIRQLQAGSDAKLIVFVPSDEKPRTIEKLLLDRMPGWEITVFGKAKDLENAVHDLKPDVVLAPAPTLSALGLSVALHGKRDGDIREPYVLITVDQKIPPQEMGKHSVGIYGIMGRNEMKHLCGQLLGTNDQQIKTVTKYADLLPLLQFQATKGVVLPKRFSSVLTGRSALRLVVTDLPNGKVELVSAALRNSSFKGKVAAALQGLGTAARDALGVDGWQG